MYDLREDVDYQLIAPPDAKDNSWHVRILTSEFVETVIQFKNIVVDGKNDCLKFNFDIISSPITGLTTADLELQEMAGRVLNSVLGTAAEEGSLGLKDL